MHRSVAQLAEHVTLNHGVEGSSPSGPANLLIINYTDHRQPTTILPILNGLKISRHTGRLNAFYLFLSYLNIYYLVFGNSSVT